MKGMQSKAWYKSITVWIGVFGAIGGSADVIVQFLQAGDFSLTGIFAGIMGLATIVQRFRTTAPIHFKE
jgi:hypothetical protein